MYLGFCWIIYFGRDTFWSSTELKISYVEVLSGAVARKEILASKVWRSSWPQSRGFGPAWNNSRNVKRKTTVVFFFFFFFGWLVAVSRTGQISSVIQIRIYGDNFLSASASFFFQFSLRSLVLSLCAYVNGELSSLRSLGKSNAICANLLFHFISRVLLGRTKKTTSKLSMSLQFLFFYFCSTCLSVSIHTFFLTDRYESLSRLLTNPT